MVDSGKRLSLAADSPFYLCPLKAFSQCVHGGGGACSFLLRGMSSARAPTILTSSNAKYPLDPHLHDHLTQGLAFSKGILRRQMLRL